MLGAALTLLLAVWIAAPGLATSRKEVKQPAQPQKERRAVQAQRLAVSELLAPRNGFRSQGMPRLLPDSKAADANVTIYGIISGSTTSQLVSFPAAPFTEFNVVKESEDLDASGSGVFADGLFYNLSLNVLMGQVMGAECHVWNPDGWTLERTMEDLWSSSCARDLAYNPVDGKVWGQFYQEDMQNLWWGWIDTATGSTTRLNTLGVEIMALACTQTGDMYAIIHNGKLIKIDAEAGTYETIGNTGLMPRYLQSAAIDPVSGRFYWAAYLEDNTSGLYEVDLTTAQATLITPFPDNAEINALFIMPPLAENDAPGAIESIQTIFENGSLSGRVKVTTPENTYGGEPINDFIDTYLEVTGPNGYTAQKDDNDWAGAEIPFFLNLPEPGLYTFKAYCANEAGNGPAKTVKAWIGAGVPAAVTGIQTTQDNRNVTISWEAPTELMNGGYLDPSKLTYDVVRLPDGKEVATGISATSVTDELPEGSFSAFQYSITAINDGQRSEPAISGTVGFGNAFDVPYAVDIDNKDARDLFTIIDANGDGNTFTANFSDDYILRQQGLPSDDWIVSPPVNIKTGKQYKVSFLTYINNALFSPEMVELACGSQPAVESMTTVFAQPDPIQGFREYVTVEGLFTPTEDGVYYFGMHDFTGASNSYIEVMGFSIEEGPSLTAPLAVTDLKAIAASNGVLNATLSFTAPVKDYSGNDLTTLDRIEIRRGQTVIGTIENPAPGSEQTYTDLNAQQGDNTYTVVPFGAAGEKGDHAETTVYVGVDKPSVPSNVKLTREGNNLILTWNVPTEGANGGYINPDELVYSIYSSLHQAIIVENVTGTMWGADITSLLEEAQTPIYFGVYAVNAAGGSTGVQSNTLVIGKPYEVPFYESFNYGFLQNEMWIVDDATGECGWEPVSGLGGNDTAGYSAFSAAGTGDQRLTSGIINLTDVTEPYLEFLAKGTPAMGHLDIEITTDYTNFQTIKTVEFDDEEWHCLELPLAEYAGQPGIQVSFHGYGIGDTYYDIFECGIDEIRVEQKYEHNLRASAFEISKNRVEVGEEPVQFTFEVSNRGKNVAEAGAWNLRVMQDGKERTIIPGVDVQPGETAVLNYEFVPTFDDPDNTEFYSNVAFDADLYADDNSTAALKIQVDKPEWPSVSELNGTFNSASNTAELSWVAPDFSGTPAGTVEESFDSYQSFDIEKAGDWKLYDGDGSYTYTITGFGWSHTYMPQAWIVWTPSEVSNYIDDEPLSAVWWPRTGDKCMACFAADCGLNNDWLISPELSGDPQEISFWGRSTIDEYGLERFEVWYSTTDDDVNSFQRLGDDFTAVQSNWTEYHFQLPAGARYFAIRCVSPDRFCLLIDDVTFERAARPLPVQFLGYNIYRNGTRLNEAPVTDSHYSTPALEASDFYVKVAYDKGESAASNSVTLGGNSGIDGITVSDKASGTIYDMLGRKVLNPVPGTIYVRDGEKFVYRP